MNFIYINKEEEEERTNKHTDNVRFTVSEHMWALMSGYKAEFELRWKSCWVKSDELDW